jgi:hypothetical protein
MSAARIRTVKKKVRVRVSYGVGGSIEGLFPRQEVAGKSARDVIGLVVSSPQPSSSAERTRKVLEDVFKTQQAIDAELTRAASGEEDGEPISLHQVVVKEEDGEEQSESRVTQESEELTIRLSEPYRGGTKWQSERRVDRV